MQLYIHDVLSSMTGPVKELKGFEKTRLKPGEQKTVTFQLATEHLSMLDRNLESKVEPGRLDVMVGASSEDIRPKGSFTVK